jgi:hypothetical protein
MTMHLTQSGGDVASSIEISFLAVYNCIVKTDVYYEQATLEILRMLSCLAVGISSSMRLLALSKRKFDVYANCERTGKPLK